MKEELNIIIMENSDNTDDVINAEKEWILNRAFVNEKRQDCPCSKNNIRYICEIVNINNGNILEVGNCCVKNFLDIKIRKLIISNINKISEDTTNKLSKKVVEFLYEKNIINDFEKMLYLKIKGAYDELSNKQINFRKKINLLFLSYMWEKDLIIEMMDDILSIPYMFPYNKKLVNNFKTFYLEKGYLSQKQFRILEISKTINLELINWNNIDVY